MRYAEEQFAEKFIAIGIFETGDTVTVRVLDAGSDALLTLSNATAVESTVMDGVFIWDSDKFTTPPTGFSQCIVEMTNTAGRVHLGKFITGGFPSDLAKARYQRTVHIDTVAGTPLPAAAFSFDIGTEENPVSNVADARIIADFLGLRSYHLIGGSTITLSVDHLEWEILGSGPNSDSVVMAGTADIAGTQFQNLTLTGTFDGRVSAQNCLIGTSNVSVANDLEGVFETIGLLGTINVKLGGKFEGANIVSRAIGVTPVTIDLGGSPGGTTLLLSGVAGLINLTGVFNTSLVGLISTGAIMEFEGTVTGGFFFTGGIGELTNNGAQDFFFDNMMRASVQQQVQQHIVAAGEIDITTDPWTEIRKGESDSGPLGAAPDTFTIETYELYDQDGVALAGDETSGNNPLADPSRLIAQRRRI